MKKILLRLLIGAGIIYLLLCLLVYTFQEKMIFFPEKLEAGHSFEFSQPFEELSFKTADAENLSAVLFRADSSRGIILYLHGNGGSALQAENFSHHYTSLGYDLLVLDYRGYGKSGGAISSEKQFFGDLQLVYDQLKLKYNESDIVVLGYSIGTGPAAYLASRNQPRLLILQAPYYSLSDMMGERYPYLPKFLLKYKFNTYQHLQQCTMPVAIFHGNMDEVIGYESSLKLKKFLKPSDRLLIIEGHGHGEMSAEPAFVNTLDSMLRIKERNP